MRAPREPLMVPREAPVYSADMVKLGVVQSIGMRYLRIRQGFLMTRYLDIPVRLVDHVANERVYLSTSMNVALAAARAVPFATTPEAPPEDDAATAALPSFEIPYDAPVLAHGGARLGTTVDATPTTIIVKVGKLRPYRLSLPASIIDRVEGEQVWLKVSEAEAKEIGEGRMAPPSLLTNASSNRQYCPEGAREKRKV